ncbi:signal peptide peptidase SppA [Myroides sp. DF42-4-2]|uniref:signal peptide peptidase SppA n=1 Tax=unclassified Myroides TaxID=2642485 RepID=UPI002575CDF4|nr:signal peptide peptidase SppA [Myroides sp. DF42-4-2]MDM1406509.1 signal peptide peptidase SppA [Myroides sp. DF42-4-2]
MKFLRNLLATLLGLCIFFGILFVGFIAIIAVAGSSETVLVKNNSVLELDLSTVQYDYGGKFSYKDFNFNDQRKDGVSDVIMAIEQAKNDDRIKGISMLNTVSSLGFVQRREIREKLQEFKSSGKFVVSYSNALSQGEYYLNSVADTVFVNPVGAVDFRGLSTEILYLKGLQDQTGVHMEVIRHGKYKSAVEPYLEKQMSEANREQITVFLNSIWSTLVADVSKSRSIAVDSLNDIATNLAARTPERALALKLIDKVAYEDEYHAGIKKALEMTQDKDYNKISVLEYIKADNPTKKASTDQIAVIYAQGQILNGEGNVNYIGEGSINRALKKARNNDKVKAIVLRVNSPGGSALTSELIWREVELTKKVKPVIVSMGDLAASGGYYIASGADRIFADPATITGSIGVFGMLPNFSTLATKYGVNAEQVKTHQNAASYSPFRKVDDSFKSEVTESIEFIYETFVNRVAAGRNMTFEKVDEIAQGRVWTGVDALEKGLVDELGGLNAAIAYAANKVEIEDYKVVNYPEYELKINDLLRNYLGASIMQTQDELLKEKIGQENFEMMERLNYFQSLKGAQAIMPFEIKIQ